MSPRVYELAPSVLVAVLMRVSIPSWCLGLAFSSLSLLGCQSQVTVDDPGCKEPKPDIPAGTWCPPSYECVDGEWINLAGACPEPACPQSNPLTGTPCDMVGQTCPYFEDVPCGETEQVEAVCTEDGWESITYFCSPEPVCPDELPLLGTDCEGWYDAFSCYYPIETACGEEVTFVYCDLTEQGATWAMTAGPECSICSDYDTEAECGVAKECQWLTPGCGMEPAVQTGCYPKNGCDVTSCNDDSICVETSYNPCYGEVCEACGASSFACLPGWAP